MLSVEPPWWRRTGVCKSLEAFFNKHLCVLLLLLLFLLLPGHGGKGEKRGDVWPEMLCSYPSGVASVLLAWESRSRRGAPWWSSHVSGFNRCGSNKLEFEVRLRSTPDLLQSRSCTLTLIILAGRSGEGEEKCGVVLCETGAGRSARFLHLVSSRDTGWLRPKLSDELLRKEKEEMVSVACSFHKRVCCAPSGMISVFLLLADRGGEGEDGDGVAAGLGWRIGWWRCEFDATSMASLVMSTPTSSSLALHCYLSGWSTVASYCACWMCVLAVRDRPEAGVSAAVSQI